MIEFPHLVQTISLLISLASLATVIIMARGKAASDRVESLGVKLDDKASVGRLASLEGRVHGLEERASRTESRLEYVPDKDAAHRLEVAIARLEGRMETLDERLKPVAAMASRVHERMFEEAVR